MNNIKICEGFSLFHYVVNEKLGKIHSGFRIHSNVELTSHLRARIAMVSVKKEVHLQK